MIKSELVRKVAEANPSLHQRYVEHIVNAILDKIIKAYPAATVLSSAGLGPSRSRTVKREPDAVRVPAPRLL